MNPLESNVAGDARKKAFSLFDEFKKFAFKGNVIDLAVGVIIGGAFGKIVASLVDHIFMPAIGLLVGADPTKGFEGLEWEGIKYGSFLATVVNFLIVALALFVFIVKFLGWIMKSKKEEAVTPPPPTKDQELLGEIRDLLRSRTS